MKLISRQIKPRLDDEHPYAVGTVLNGGALPVKSYATIEQVVETQGMLQDQGDKNHVVFGRIGDTWSGQVKVHNY
ncbi:hypothetical protein HN832_04275 [archaeon]|jgi:hypothetical protein|nr:hypothetical protein [archaeon]MBT4373389.1 hypothetical protein [archaeon]MBT4531837.1 hypothetical protein [archaeon]MBT7001504.1 hypothetical protein [archaeon]MBT7282604.1 hypothetical protein [archaeon]